MENPNDDTSWLRVVNFPARGIGARTLEQLSDLARQHNCSLFRAVPLMSGKGGANLAKFAALIEQMTHEAQILPLPELVDHVIYHSGLLAHYQNERDGVDRSEEHTSELQSLMRTSYAVFWLKKKKQQFKIKL